MAPTPQAEVKLIPPEPIPEPSKPRTGIRAVLFGPPGCGKGTQVVFKLLFYNKIETFDIS